MAQPLLARLREKRPHMKLDVLEPEWVAPVARRMPEVDEVIPVPFRHGSLQLGSRWKLGRALKHRYDEAIVLPNSWKSALVPFLAHIPVRTGYVGESRFGLLNRLHRNPDRHMREHYARLAESPGNEARQPLPQACLKMDPAQVAATCKRFDVKAPYAVLCPGAEYGPAKRWPYFAELATRLALPPVLLGSRNDATAAAGIEGKNLIGKTTLDEAIDLIAGAQYIVTNDSGLMHVAAALGRPLVALFGSSSPEKTPPQSSSGSTGTRGLGLKAEVRPCFQREIPLRHFRCMREISVDQVMAEVA